MLQAAELYYRILDLEPGASPEEIHQGYLDLTWVWHPDRFAGHPRLQQKAHCKLQQLNEAHERLRSFLPASQKRDSLAKTRSQATSPSRQPSQGENSYKPQRKRVGGEEEIRTRENCSQRVVTKTAKLDEWLD